MSPSLDHLQEHKQLRNSFTCQYIKYKHMNCAVLEQWPSIRLLSQEFLFPRLLILADYFPGTMYGSFVVCCLLENEWRPSGSFILLSHLGFELCCWKRMPSALTFNSNPPIIKLTIAVPCCITIFSAIEPSDGFEE